jgi:hypothetical protein
MTQKVTLLVPDAPVPAAATGAGLRELAESGVRFGLLDNGKGNADHLLRMVAEAVRATLPIASVFSVRKSRPSEPAPPEILDELAREADCVVSAMAD